MHTRSVFLRAATLALFCLTGPACSLLLGSDSDEGESGGSGGSAASGGAAETGGASASGGVTTGGMASGGSMNTGGDSGTGGLQSGGATSTGGAITSGGSSMTGGQPAGTGGAAGGGGTLVTDGPVRGTVVDLFGNAVPAAKVVVDGVLTTTDENGEFEFATANETYNAEVYNVGTRYSYQIHFLTYFVGLTRRDPILQIRSAGKYNDADAVVRVTYPEDSFPGNAFMRTVYEGDHSSFLLNEVGIGGTNYLGLASYWGFASATVGTAHSILIETDPNSDDIPINYLRYHDQAVAIDETNDATFTVDFSQARTVTTATVAATVSTPLDILTWNTRGTYWNVYLRYDDAATMPLHDGRLVGETFTFPVPQLAGTTGMVAVYAGDSTWGPYSVQYKDYVAPGTTDVEVELMSPPSLVAPSDGATDVTTGTTLTWAPAVPGVHDVMLSDWNHYYVRIVAAGDSIALPEFESGFDVAWITQAYYYVEKHDHFATVDEAAGTALRYSAWTESSDRTRGPKRGDGSYAFSPVYYVNP